MIVPPSRIVCTGCAQAERGQGGTGRIQSRQRNWSTRDPVRRELRLPHLIVMMSCDGTK